MYAHDNGAIFVMDAARRSERMPLDDLLVLAGSCRAAGDRMVVASDASSVASDVVTRIRESGAMVVEFVADPPQAWSSGTTALMEAAANGWQRILDDLIARGIPVDERDDSGSTALHHAAGAGQVGAIDALIAAGADCDRPNLFGLTPYQLARSSGHIAAANRLAASGANTVVGPSEVVRFSRRHAAVLYVWVVLALVLLAIVVPVTWASAGWPFAAIVAVAIVAAYRLLWPKAFWLGGIPRRLTGSQLTVRRITGATMVIELDQVTIAGIGGSPPDRRQKPRWLLLAHPDGHPTTPRTMRRLLVADDETELLTAHGDRFVLVVMDGRRAADVLLSIGNVLTGGGTELTPSLHRQLSAARTEAWSPAQR